MRILGLTQRQSDIVKAVHNGENYSEIGERLGINERIVIRDEFIALSILSDRWKKEEVDVKKQFKSLFLVALCLYMSHMNFASNINAYSDSNNDDFNRVVRTGRSGRNTFIDTTRVRGGRKGGRKGGKRGRDSDSSEDEHDLFAMIV
jgi:hypothetical protein